MFDTARNVFHRVSYWLLLGSEYLEWQVARQYQLKACPHSVSIAIESRSNLVQSCLHLCVFLRGWIYVDRIAIQVTHLW